MRQAESHVPAHQIAHERLELDDLSRLSVGEVGLIADLREEAEIERPGGGHLGIDVEESLVKRDAVEDTLALAGVDFQKRLPGSVQMEPGFQLALEQVSPLVFALVPIAAHVPSGPR